MKVKKYIGKTFNGFLLLDSYPKILESGKATRKVLLQCQSCGRVFERSSSVDFDHVKCKCKCKSLIPKKEIHHYIEYNGKRYILTEFCRLNGINVSTFNSRIRNGATIEQALSGQFECVCEICGKTFISGSPKTRMCSNTCRGRKSKGRGAYKPILIKKCIVCGTPFETLKESSIVCSRSCRMAHDRIVRNRRYKELKKTGNFDHTVTLIAVFEKYDGKCQICGKEMTFDVDWLCEDYPSIDHIIPLSKGGSHTWGNVQLLCRRCNYYKGDAI